MFSVNVLAIRITRLVELRKVVKHLYDDGSVSFGIRVLSFFPPLIEGIHCTMFVLSSLMRPTFFRA